MSLIICEDCGNKVSDKAECCPECGCPVAKTIICYECGASYLILNKSCPKCGAPKKVLNKSTIKDNFLDFEKVKDKISISSNSKKNKTTQKSPFPVWLPLITIPLVLIISTSINNSQRQQTQPPIVNPLTGRGGSGLDICQLCKITNSCDTLPQCTTKQKTCEWKETWDGKIVEKCSSF